MRLLTGATMLRLACCMTFSSGISSSYSPKSVALWGWSGEEGEGREGENREGERGEQASREVYHVYHEKNESSLVFKMVQVSEIVVRLQGDVQSSVVVHERKASLTNNSFSGGLLRTMHIFLRGIFWGFRLFQTFL